MAHAAESTHWYRAENGEPCYEVMGANGQMRPTTLRDARKLNLVPSVTTIIRCADRPGLTNWMVDQGILSALTLPRLQDEPESLWLRRVKEDSKEQAKKAAERGTAIHAAIQGHYEGKPPAIEYWPHVMGAAREVNQWLGWEKWLAERPFAHALGFGGKLDLHVPLAAVVDVKTKEFGPEDKLQTWDEHAMQLAAYREGLQMPKARAAVCYVSVSHPGVARMIEIKPDELERGWQCFKSLLSFWQAKNRYWPEMKVAA
jgi:hypothetical protein